MRMLAMQNDRRSRIRASLAGIYIPFYDKLCVSLPEEWQPYSGIRSFASQDMLYAAGRRQDADGVWHIIDQKVIVTNAKAGESAHNYGCATDWTRWTLDDEPIWMKKEDPEWQNFIDAVSSTGLRPGAEFGDVDHAELKIAVPWTTIATIFRDRSMSGALASIQAALCSNILV